MLERVKRRGLQLRHVWPRENGAKIQLEQYLWVWIKINPGFMLPPTPATLLCVFVGWWWDWSCWSTDHVYTTGGGERLAGAHGGSCYIRVSPHPAPSLRLKQSPGQMSSGANTGTQLRAHDREAEGERERWLPAPGVTNGIAPEQSCYQIPHDCCSYPGMAWLLTVWENQSQRLTNHFQSGSDLASCYLSDQVFL